MRLAVDGDGVDVDAVSFAGDDEGAAVGEVNGRLGEHWRAKQESADAGDTGVKAKSVPDVNAGGRAEVVVPGNAAPYSIERNTYRDPWLGFFIERPRDFRSTGAGAMERPAGGASKWRICLRRCR